MRLWLKEQFLLCRYWCGRAILTLLSVVILSVYSTEFLPKCTTCLWEQPAPQPRTPLAQSHLCTTDRQVHTTLCIPSLFHVNLFYWSKYPLQLLFYQRYCVKICTTKRKRASAYIHKLPRSKIHIATSNMLSQWRRYECSFSSMQIHPLKSAALPKATFISHMQGEKLLRFFSTDTL